MYLKLRFVPVWLALAITSIQKVPDATWNFRTTVVSPSDATGNRTTSWCCSQWLHPSAQKCWTTIWGTVWSMDPQPMGSSTSWPNRGNDDKVLTSPLPQTLSVNPKWSYVAVLQNKFHFQTTQYQMWAYQPTYYTNGRNAFLIMRKCQDIKEKNYFNSAVIF